MNPTDTTFEKLRSLFGARSLFVLAALLTLATMGRVATHEFVDWDDRFLLADNPKFNPPTWKSVLGYVLPRNVDENLYIPATQLAWGALAAIGHTDQPDPTTRSLLDPWVFHCANLALHVASVGMVFAIVRCFVSDLHAWIGAMVFAVHPVQVETVAWVSGLRDLLAALFGFVCLYQLIQYRRTDGRIHWALATIMVLLAMLSKPSAVAVPLSALVVDWVLLRTRISQSIACLWPWFLLSIPMILITRHVQPMLWPIDNPLISRPLIAMDAVAFYISKILWPVHLAFDYGRTPHAVLAGRWQPIWIIPPLAAALLVWKRRQFPRIIGGCLLALAGIVPVLGLVSFAAQDYSTVSDHYLYPSMLGVALIAASLVERGVLRFGGPAIYTITFVALAAMAVQSFAITDVWTDDHSLFSNALAVNPRSSNANAGLGLWLASAGDLASAKQRFGLAEQLNPHNGMAITGLANVLLHEGDLDGAASQYERLMQVYQMQSNFDPKLAASAEIVIAARLIRRHDTTGAIGALEQARKWDPSNPRIGQMIARANMSVPPPPSSHAAR